MKKTTLLLIGAFAFVLQGAMAQTTLYSDNFEDPVNQASLTISGAPWTSPFVGADAGHGAQVPSDLGAWGGNTTASSYTVVTVNDPNNPLGTTTAAELDYTVGSGGWFGYSTYGITSNTHTSLAAGVSLNEITVSFDIEVLGSAAFAGATPVTTWFDQFPGGIKSFDASYTPSITLNPIDGSGWDHVSFTLDNLVPSGTSGAYNPTLGFELGLDGGTGVDTTTGATGSIIIDNILITDVPEPGTIALLTLGGLGALVAIRRRSV